MNTTALLLAVAIASNPPSVASGPRGERGFLSALGVGLIVVAGAGVGLGVASVMGASDASTKLKAYQGTVSAEERPSTKALEDRFGTNLALAISSFGLGALALAGGIVCFFMDRPTVKVAFAPGPHGGVLVLSGHF